MIRAGVVIGMIFAIAASGAGMARTANATLATPAKVSLVTSTINARVLAPAACANRGALGTAGANVYVAGASGNFAGGAGNDLVLGRPHTANYTLNGGNGNDCVVGGKGTAGTETIRGGGGTDYCIGNGSTAPGTQSFNADCDGNTVP
jgi:Ca2+-binding RTX toxin-like protein